VNGLTWGGDGWVYGANGRSDGDIRRPDEFQGVSLRGLDFRFRPDTGEYQTRAGRSQFGLGLDDWGNRFLSWNTIPARHDGVPLEYLLKNPRLSTSSGVVAVQPAEDDGRVFPRTPTPKTFNQESTAHYNALAGLIVFRGDALPPGYAGNLFVGETLRNLVHRRILQPRGSSFTAVRGEKDREFLASTDPWFHPVNFATGPDGALYVADFYRSWVEHPNFVPEKLRNAADWREGSQHGRIWRIRSKKKNPAPFTPLSKATAEELVKLLENPNGWKRDTAQRLLWERRDLQAIAGLKEVAVRGALPQSRVQALLTLHPLNGLAESNLLAGLADPQPRVREVAVRLCETQLVSSPMLLKRVAGLAKDRDDRVRLQVALSISAAPVSERTEVLYQVSQNSALDALQAIAIRCSAGERPWPLLEQILWGERSYLDPTPDRLEFLRSLASDVGAAGPEQDRASLIAMLVNFRARGLTTKHLALFAGLIDGWSGVDHAWSERFRSLCETEERKAWLDDFVSLARQTAEDPKSENLLARLATEVLARAGTKEARAALAAFLKGPQREALQTEAARAWGKINEAAQWKEVLSQWPSYSVRARRALITSATSSPEATIELVQAIEEGRIAVTELDPAAQQTLRQNRIPELTERIAKALGQPASEDRQRVIETFAAALSQKGDPARGAAHFARACLSCHQLQGKGQLVGPDLAGLGNRTKEALLSDLLDPSRQVAADFVSYTAQTETGETITGILISETSAGVTLRRPGLSDELIPRAQLKQLQASGKSLMPDGLESGMTPADMADLLEFLLNPGSAKLP
jgi:putative heme-binding domain-containing protein